MFRFDFLQSITAALVGSALPTSSPSPGGMALPKDFNPRTDCFANPALPYDRPLGMTMRVLDGPDFDLQHYRGYAVWINIFATWCPPCNQEQPIVARLAAEYYDRGLRVIGMDSEEKDDVVRAYRAKYGLTYPIAMDANGTFSAVLETKGNDIEYPGHLFIDPAGYLNCFLEGGFDETTMRYKIEAILKPLAIPPSPGPMPTRTPFPTPTPTTSPAPTPG